MAVFKITLVLLLQSVTNSIVELCSSEKDGWGGGGREVDEAEA